MNSQINFASVSESIWAFWDSLSSEEQSQLAHLKRYYELLTGDPDFSGKVKTFGLAPAAAEHGCFLDMDLVKPLWDPASRENFAPEKWPLFDLYRRFGDVRLLARDNMVKVGDPGATNRRFSKWRERQIKRVKFETADSTSSVVHPVAAFELSEGCTMGCWFCGVSAAKFAGYLPYDCETETLWRGMLGVMQEKFGSAAGSAFCYWATDPMDNPDYFKYISAFSEIIGSVPQTTTAAALRDVDKIREILRFSAERRSIVNRFSVLTTKQLRGIWAEFTAEEIVHVELVMQNKGASTKKRAAGGALKRRNRRSEVKGAEENKDFVSGSIACVTGFLINLKLKRIQLVSPALPSADIPDGYIIFGELFFHDVGSFSDCVDRLMTKFMPEKISSTDLIEFHPNVTVEPVNEGFAIFNDLNEVQFPRFGNLAKIIGEGGHRVDAIVKLASDEGVEPLAALGFVNSAFKSGLLNERLLQSAFE